MSISKYSGTRSAKKSGGIRPPSVDLKLPVLATNGVRYATAYDREILDLFTAIRNHTQSKLRTGMTANGIAKGLRRQAADALIAAGNQDGPFRSADDLALRVPELNRKELTLLAQVGALNRVEGVAHRRDAL